MDFCRGARISGPYRGPEFDRYRYRYRSRSRYSNRRAEPEAYRRAEREAYRNLTETRTPIQMSVMPGR